MEVVQTSKAQCRSIVGVRSERGERCKRSHSRHATVKSGCVQCNIPSKRVSATSVHQTRTYQGVGNDTPSILAHATTMNVDPLARTTFATNHPSTHPPTHTLSRYLSDLPSDENAVGVHVGNLAQRSLCWVSRARCLTRAALRRRPYVRRSEALQKIDCSPCIPHHVSEQRCPAHVCACTK